MKFSLLLIFNMNLHLSTSFHNLMPRRKIFNVFALSLIKPYMTNKYYLDINNNNNCIDNNCIDNNYKLNDTRYLKNIDYNNADSGNIVPSGFIQVNNNNIYFYSPINIESCFNLKTILLGLDNELQEFKIKYNIEPPPINLHIQSGGGELMPTLYIIDLIKSLKTPLHSYVDGYAASAATLISVVADKRFMTNNSLILIHQLSGGQNGKMAEMEDEMTNLNTLMTIIRDVYLENTKLNDVVLNRLLLKDIWLTSDICLKYNIVDEVI